MSYILNDDFDGGTWVDSVGAQHSGSSGIAGTLPSSSIWTVQNLTSAGQVTNFGGTRQGWLTNNTNIIYQDGNSNLVIRLGPQGTYGAGAGYWPVGSCATCNASGTTNYPEDGSAPKYAISPGQSCEVRVKTNPVNGLWPAVWFEAAAGAWGTTAYAEIDLMESGDGGSGSPNPSQTRVTIWGGYPTNQYRLSLANPQPALTTLGAGTGGYDIFRVDLYGSYFNIFINGTQVYTLTSAQAAANWVANGNPGPAPWPFTSGQWYVILEVETDSTISGNPTGTLPVTSMTVDYVRMWSPAGPDPNTSSSTTKKIATLTDSFPGTSLNGTLWTSSAGGGVIAVNNGLSLTDTASSATYTTITSSALYDLASSAIYINLVSAGTQQAGTQSVLGVVNTGSNNGLYLLVSNGLLTVEQNLAGVYSTPATATYNSTSMAWLQISESAGTVTFSYAALSSGPWTSLYTVADPFALSSVNVLIQEGTNVATSPAATSVWKSLNTSNYTVIQQGAGGGGSPTTAITATTAGTCLIVTCVSNNATGTCTATNGTTIYTLSLGTFTAGHNGDFTGIWFLPNCPAGLTSVTVTSAYAVGYLEVNGISGSTSAVLDTSGGGNATAGTSFSCTRPTTAPGYFTVYAYSYDVSNAGTPFADGLTGDHVMSNFGQFSYTAGGTGVSSGTLGSSGTYDCAGVSFQPATAAIGSAGVIPADAGFGMFLPSITAVTVSAAETGIGRRLDFLMDYRNWNNGTSAWPTPPYLAIIGSRPLVWTIQPSSGPYGATAANCVQWPALIAGSYDAQIIAFATWVNANLTLAPVIYVRFAHEMNGTGWYDWQVGGSCGVTSAANYAAGFNHVASVLKANSSKILMVWSPNVQGPAVAPFYPSGCDIMAWDGYNNVPANTWLTDSEVHAVTYAAVAACDPVKPIWIGEHASQDASAFVYNSVTYGPFAGKTKSGWAETFLSSAAYPRLAATTWFNLQKERQWQWDSSADSISGFQQAFTAYTSTTGSSRWNPATGAISGAAGSATAYPSRLTITASLPPVTVSVSGSATASPVKLTVTTSLPIPAVTAGSATGSLTESSAAAWTGDDAGNSYTSGSFTPAANSLLVAVCATGNANGITVTGVAVTDSAGGTWTQIARAGAGAVFSDASVWVKDAGASPPAQAATVTFSPSGVLAGGIAVRQFTGAAPAASQTGVPVSGTGTTGSVAITPGTSGSRVVGAYGGGNGTTMTVNGTTTLYGQSSAGVVTEAGFEASSLSVNGTPVTVGFTATQTGAAIAAVEILPAASSSNATATPAVLTAASAYPAAAAHGNVSSTAVPARLSVTASLPTVTATGTLTSGLSYSAAYESAYEAGAAGSTTVTPAVLARSSAYPALAAHGSAASAPFLLSVTTSLPSVTVTVSGSASTSPASLTAAATVPIPLVSVTGNAAIAVAVLAVSRTQPLPAVSGSASVSPLALSASAAIPGPAVSGSAAASPAALSALTTKPAVTVTGGVATSPYSADHAYAVESAFYGRANAETAHASESAQIAVRGADHASAPERTLTVWPSARDAARAAERGWWSSPQFSSDTGQATEAVRPFRMTGADISHAADTAYKTGVWTYVQTGIRLLLPAPFRHDPVRLERHYAAAVRLASRGSWASLTLRVRSSDTAAATEKASFTCEN